MRENFLDFRREEYPSKKFPGTLKNGSTFIIERWGREQQLPRPVLVTVCEKKHWAAKSICLGNCSHWTLGGNQAKSANLLLVQDQNELKLLYRMPETQLLCNLCGIDIQEPLWIADGCWMVRADDRFWAVLNQKTSNPDYKSQFLRLNQTRHLSRRDSCSIAQSQHTTRHGRALANSSTSPPLPSTFTHAATCSKKYQGYVFPETWLSE